MRGTGVAPIISKRLMPIAYRIDEGRRLLATTTHFVFGTARMYQSITDEESHRVRVFRDIGEARSWLGLPADEGS